MSNEYYKTEDEAQAGLMDFCDQFCELFVGKAEDVLKLLHKYKISEPDEVVLEMMKEMDNEMVLMEAEEKFKHMAPPSMELH